MENDDVVELPGGRIVSRIWAEIEREFSFPAPTTQTLPSSTTVEATPVEETKEEKKARAYREFCARKEEKRLAEIGFELGQKPTPAAEEDARALFGADGVGNAAVLNRLALRDKPRYLAAVAAARYKGLVAF